MQCRRNPPLSGFQERDPRDLGSPHHRRDVVLAEHPLHGHDLRGVLLERRAQTPRDREQSLVQRVLGAGPDDPGVDERRAATARRVDHPDAAPGEAGIDPEDPRRFIRSSPMRAVRSLLSVRRVVSCAGRSRTVRRPVVRRWPARRGRHHSGSASASPCAATSSGMSSFDKDVLHVVAVLEGVDHAAPLGSSRSTGVRWWARTAPRRCRNPCPPPAARCARRRRRWPPRGPRRNTSSVISSAPASRTTSSRVSSVSSPLGTVTTPLRSNR